MHDREEALDITYKTDPEMYRMGLTTKNELIELYDTLVNASSKAEKDVAAKVKQALLNFIALFRRDVDRVFDERLQNYTMADANYLDPKRQTLLRLSKEMITELQQLVVSLSKTSGGKAQIMKSNDLINSFSDEVRQFMHLIENQTIESLDSYFPDVTKYLPDKYFLEHSCKGSITSLTGILSNVQALLNETRLESQSVDDLRSIVSSMSTYILPETRRCINGYPELLQKLHDEEEILKSRGTPDWLDIKTDTATLNFTVISENVTAFAKDGKDIIEKYKNGIITSKEFIDGFFEEVVKYARGNISSFQRNLVSNHIQLWESRTRSLKEVIQSGYIELIEYDYKLTKYFVGGKVTKVIRTLSLWERNEPDENDIAKIKTRSPGGLPDENSGSFSQKQAEGLVQTLVPAYVKPLNMKLSAFLDEVNRKVIEINDHIDEAMKSHEDVVRTLAFDEDFVK